MAFSLYLASYDDRRILPDAWENNWPLLYSQINNRGVLNNRFDAPTKGKLLVDSGAHSAHTKGIEIDLEEYIDYANEHMDDITLYVQVDKIPGVYRMPKTARDWLEAPQLSWENYLYMRSRSKDPDKLIPVFHQGEDLKWLRQMCDYRFSDGKQIPYIGLSPRGDVSLKAKYEFSAECFSVIQSSSNPNVKTHAFGATSLEMLERLPYTSADSTTWVLVSAYGQVWMPNCIDGDVNGVGIKLGVSKENITHPTATQTYWEQSAKVKRKLDDYFESIGTNIEELSVSHTARSLASAKYVQKWAENYEYKGLESFVTTRNLF